MKIHPFFQQARHGEGAPGGGPFNGRGHSTAFYVYTVVLQGLAKDELHLQTRKNVSIMMII